MYGYIPNQRIIFLFSIALFIIFCFSENAFSQRSRTKTTSPLIITNISQDAECVVTNVGSSAVDVNIKLISGVEIINGDHSIEPNQTIAVDTTLVGFGNEFYCRFTYTGNRSEIRAIARILDFSAGLSVPQRAEATED